MRLRFFLLSALVLGALAPGLTAQWDPANGDWSKAEPNDIRVMTWNVFDSVCSSNLKTEGQNDWTSVALSIAAMKPDVLLMQEVGDNSGNGTGSGVDSVTTLTNVLELLMHGGSDPYRGGTVTAYVQKYAPGYDLPFIFVTTESDGFNRNVILSRFPFTDLNGDTRSTYTDIPLVASHLYAPGGDGGIRGFQFVELDLPDAVYPGDLVVGGSHLKAGGGSSDLAQRLAASQNVAYLMDHWYNGAGTGSPDPFAKVLDAPAATTILNPNTPIVIGGDWNEDEDTNGRRGPAAWLTGAQLTGGTDGVDRDRSDMTWDSALHPFTGDDRTIGSGSKLDYIAWQDSVVPARNSWVFYTFGIPAAALPPEIAAFAWGALVSGIASDHRAVLVDFEGPPTGPADLVMLDPSPGIANQVNTFSVLNGTPGEFLYYFYGLRTGSTPVPTCPGLFFDMRNATYFGRKLADGSGRADLLFNVPNKARNRTVRLQAAEAATCRLSNLVIYSFPP